MTPPQNPKKPAKSRNRSNGGGADRPRRPRPPAPAGVMSRVAAAELLLATAEGADLDSAMGRSTVYGRLEGSDRGFARAIASAALRGQGRIDWALGGMIDRPIDKMEAPVMALLRAGCAQLWLLEAADYAAVSATVEAARAWEPARRGGALINAVLRRASRETEAFASAPSTSVWPDWLAAKLKSALGEARANAMAELQLAEPPLDLSFKTLSAAESFADRLGTELLPCGSVRLPSGVPVRELPGYETGDWWVQDAGASLAARLLGEIRGRTIADLCAAPGGKALQLAAGQPSVLYAVDVSAQRLVQLRDNQSRTHLAMQIVEADASRWRPDAPLDAILLDAPCSALGVLRRHPEGAWRRDPKDLARFPAIQTRLLSSARDMLKTGGTLIYCVCTPSPEEGIDVVEAAIAGGGWRRKPIEDAEAPGFGHAVTAEGDLLTAPPPDMRVASDTDGPEMTLSDVFYVARLERAD